MGHASSSSASQNKNQSSLPSAAKGASPSSLSNDHDHDHGAGSAAERTLAPPSPMAAPTAVDVASQPLLGKVFALTGGCSGIALGTAKVLSRRGATVCMADIDTDAMRASEAYFSALGVPYMVSRVDISKRKDVDGWISSVVREHGRLDGACNAAGIIGQGHGIATVAELDDDEWDRILRVNLTGTMYCLRAELRHIVDGGSIVNLTSIHGLKGTNPFSNLRRRAAH